MPTPDHAAIASSAATASVTPVLVEAHNPRRLSLAALHELLANQRCPACITGELDTDYGCEACGFDAGPAALYALQRVKA